MEEETIDNKFLFLFPNLSAVLKKSIQGELAYIWHFQWIEINMTKLKKTQIHFRNDLFADVTVTDAKAP